MNLFAKLRERAEQNNRVRVGMIGAGKFGSMFLSQVLRLDGIHLIGVADLSPDNAKSNMKFVGWPQECSAVASLDEGARNGTTHVGDDW